MGSRVRRAIFYGPTSAACIIALVACGNTGATTSDSDSSENSENGEVISYNSPKEWGNFGQVHSAFSEETSINAPNDPKNSGQALAALQSESGSPVADVAYVGIAFAPQLVEAGVLQPYEPEGTEDLDDELKSDDDYWSTIHSGTVSFIVNEEFLDGAPVPESWEDLLDPMYEGKVGFLDPTQAAVGYSVATAANEVHGGDLDNWGPGLDYMEALLDNGATVSAQTSTSQVGQGEIPILIDADFNGYQLQDDGTDVEVVIPEEGSIEIPYVAGLVADAPNQENGEALLDFYSSSQGQQLWAEGFMRPASGEIPDSVSDNFLSEEEYERAETIDYVKQGEVQEEFNEQYEQRME